MKKFRFKLQKLLELRESAEKEIKNELSKILVLQNHERNKQDELRSKIDIQRKKFQEKMRSGEYKITDGISLEKFIDKSYNAIDVAEDRIAYFEPEVHKVREKLTEASKSRRVVEKLKERKYTQYMYDVDREIANENDDSNQKIFLRHKLKIERDR